MYSLRKATQEDYDFIYDLKKTTMKDYVIKTWGSWDEDVQRLFFSRELKAIEHQIIVVKDKNVGTFAFSRNETSIIIDEILILPEYQSKGIGTLIFSDIIVDAQKAKKEVTLRVLKVNYIAQKFYNKHGFEKVGDTETHFLLSKKPDLHIPDYPDIEA
ncbi:GNAT family N-acetyltransferase [Methanosarcina siciliae]|nr:GNAT family N-acetyltransferase [Methanosarcina siciliae]